MDFSIKWKLLGSFALSMLLPFLVYWMGGGFWLCIVVGLVTTLLLTSYAYYRILHSLKAIQRNLEPIYEKHGLNFGNDAHADELTAAVRWSNQLLGDMEASVEEFTSSHNDSLPRFQRGVRSEISAQLHSGESVSGELVNYTHYHESGLSIPVFDPVRNEEIFKLAVEAIETKLGEMLKLLKEENDRGIVEFQIYFLQDPNFIEGFLSNNAQGLGLEMCLENLFKDFILRLEKVKNEMIRSRITDLVDLKMQLVQEILFIVHRESRYEQTLKGRVVLIQSLFPSQVLLFHKSGVIGVICREGTSSSHSQILLESLAMPSLTELPPFPEAPDGERVLLDTEEKKVVFNPSRNDLEKLERSRQLHRDAPVLHQPVETKCGHEVEIKTNLNLPKEAHRSLTYGPDGVGLYRSEVAFLGMGHLPSEDEQHKIYQKVTRAFAGRPVVFRMLDIGGDKLVGGQSEREENPCMGMRSMRLLTHQPDLFRSQYRAMLKAAHGQTSVIFPMVNGLDELEEVMARVRQYEDEMEREGVEYNKVRHGIMVEVPGIVERFEDIVDSFDLFCIGTNDLTQYTLAADRNNQGVSRYFSPIHPALLKMVNKVCSLAKEHRKEVCLCGEVASNPMTLPLFIGLGVQQFSVPFRNIPALKALVREQDVEECRELAEAALACRTCEQVKGLIRVNMKETQLESNHG